MRIALAGNPNSGKTTLLKTLMGLQKAKSGNISIINNKKNIDEEIYKNKNNNKIATMIDTGITVKLKSEIEFETSSVL